MANPPGTSPHGTISGWLAEAVQAFTTLAGGRRIVIGSSMGGWLALLLLRRLLSTDPDAARRISGLVLLAPALDMTRALIWARLSDAARHAITARGYHLEPSRYGPEPYLYTLALIEDGNRHLMLDPGLDLPVRRASCRATRIPTSPMTTRCGAFMPCAATTSASP